MTFANIKFILLVLCGMIFTNVSAFGKTNQYYAYAGGENEIRVYSFNYKAGDLTLSQTIHLPGMNLSFMAFDEKHNRVYVINESPVGSLLSFALNPENGHLSQLNNVPTYGVAPEEGPFDGPTHIALDQSRKFIFTANYNTGNVSSYAIDKKNRQIGARISQLYAGKNAHQVVNAPAPKDRVIFTPCLGDNVVAQFAYDKQGSLTPFPSPEAFQLKGLSDSGPRHLSFDLKNIQWAYLINENASTVQALNFNANDPLQLSSLGEPISTEPNSDVINYPAEIQVHPSGKFVYASNRGSDDIAIFAIQKDGRLRFKSTVSSGDHEQGWPRHFSIDPTGMWMIVANQRPGSVNVLRINKETGDLKSTSISHLFDAVQFVQLVNVSHESVNQ